VVNPINSPTSSEEGMPEPTARNAAWIRDELILALDLYVRFKGNPPGKGSVEVRELSALLNRLSRAVGNDVPDFRNTNGVYMKMMNFRRFDPVYQAQGKVGLSRGNKLEAVVWTEFIGEPKRLEQTANAIRANVIDLPERKIDPIEIVEAEEGRLLAQAHIVRERSQNKRPVSLRGLQIRF
jgi:5-methylcytosine-specific restriction enzyme A